MIVLLLTEEELKELRRWSLEMALTALAELITGKMTQSVADSLPTAEALAAKIIAAGKEAQKAEVN